MHDRTPRRAGECRSGHRALGARDARDVHAGGRRHAVPRHGARRAHRAGGERPVRDALVALRHPREPRVLGAVLALAAGSGMGRRLCPAGPGRGEVRGRSAGADGLSPLSEINTASAQRAFPVMAKVEPIVGRYAQIALDGRTHRIYYEEAGQGMPLLCLHTAGSDGRQWRAVLNDAGILRHWRVIAFDMPWHGKSSPPEGWQRDDYRLTTDGYTAMIMTIPPELKPHPPAHLAFPIRPPPLP